MKHDLFSDNLKLYEKTIRANPNLFADILSQDQIKQYGITNNEFWKKYIILYFKIFINGGMQHGKIISRKRL